MSYFGSVFSKNGSTFANSISPSNWEKKATSHASRLEVKTQERGAARVQETRVESREVLSLVSQIIDAAPVAPRHVEMEEVLALAKADSDAGFAGIAANACGRKAYVHMRASGEDVFLVLTAGSAGVFGINLRTGESKTEVLGDTAENLAMLAGVLAGLRATAGPQVETEAEWTARMVRERAQRDAEWAQESARRDAQWADGFAQWRADVERRNREFRRNSR